MKFGILEIVGLFLVVAGCATLVGASALVSPALAMAVAGGLVILAGVLTVYVAATLEAKAKAAETRVRQ